jgi:hypothetical protein
MGCGVPELAEFAEFAEFAGFAEEVVRWNAPPQESLSLDVAR